MAVLTRPRSIRFIQILRLAIILFVAGAGFFLLRGYYGNIALYVVDIPLAALIVATLLTSLWMRQPLRAGIPLREDQLYVQVFIDVLVMSMVVFYTGASSSPLSLVLLFPVVLAAPFLYFRGSLFAASLSALTLGVLFALDASGILAPYGDTYYQSAVSFNGPDGLQVIWEWVFTAMVLFAVATTSGIILERFRINTSDVLGSVESGLLTVDDEGTVIFLNSAAREILELTGPEPEGRRFDAVLTGRLAPLAVLLHQTLEGQSLERRNEVCITTSRGTELPLGVSPTTLRHRQDVRGAVVIFQDLTEAKVVEEKIRLQDRLAVTGELAAGIAHELRNPLASISGSAEVLRESLCPEGEDGRLLDLVIDESARINRIVETFLTYARPRAADIRQCDLVPVLDDVVRLARAHPACDESKTVENDITANALVLADGDQMKQVFLNLVLNGLEAVEEGTVRILAAPEAEQIDSGRGFLEIWVQDQGPGVVARERETIFEPFYTRKRGGSGLGLSVARRIVDTHGGRILCAPDHDGNSTFRVLIPRGEGHS